MLHKDHTAKRSNNLKDYAFDETSTCYTEYEYSATALLQAKYQIRFRIEDFRRYDITAHEKGVGIIFKHRTRTTHIDRVVHVIDGFFLSFNPHPYSPNHLPSAPHLPHPPHFHPHLHRPPLPHHWRSAAPLHLLRASSPCPRRPF